MEQQFSNEIFQLNNDTADYDFPDTFNNSVFLSKGTTPKNYQGFKYISNFSLKYVVSGSESFIVEGKRKEIKSGQSLIINNGSETTFLKENGIALSIFIEPNILNDIHCTLLNEKKRIEYPYEDCHVVPELYDNPTLMDFDFLRNLSEVEKFKSKPFVTNDFYFEIAKEILLMNNAVFKKINKQDTLSLAAKKEAFRRLELARNYMMDTICDSFNLDELSRACHLSKYHLVRKFKEVHGITPHKYYINEKINRAEKIYLSNKGNISFAEIASNLGYPDYPSFSKQFKAVTGYPPSILKQSC